jgi:hypothetical protein
MCACGWVRACVRVLCCVRVGVSVWVWQVIQGDKLELLPQALRNHVRLQAVAATLRDRVRSWKAQAAAPPEDY